MRDINGIVLVNKEKDISSFKTTQEVRGLFRVKKAGHTGTLDPMATGLLIICLGKATKRVPLFMDMEKEYVGTFIFGIETDTQDMSGNILNNDKNVRIPLDAIEKVLPEFIGEIMQVPPHFSAVHHEGKRLYEWAREGKKIDLPPRVVYVKSIEILSHIYNGDKTELKLKVVCGKGMYMRALARDIGTKVASCATISQLERTRVGKHSLLDAYTINQLKEYMDKGTLSDCMVPLSLVS